MLRIGTVSNTRILCTAHSKALAQKLRCSPPVHEEARQVSVATLPSALCDGRVYARCKLGVARFSRCCHLFRGLARHHSVMGVAKPAKRSHRTRRFSKSDLRAQCCRCSCRMQWLVYLSSHPKVMQNYRQLPSNTDKSSLLAERSSA